MPDAEFRFTYEPDDGAQTLDAYDAAQALYGISRSLAILTHYSLHRRVIKQAPSLHGAKVLILPPNAGSFEFIAPIVPILADAGNATAIAQNLAASVLYDLAKTIYRRLAGKSESTSSREMQALARHASGDLDAITDAISEDIVRIQRPIASDKRRIYNINVSGGTMHLVHLDRDTLDYSRTKVVSDRETEFFGHVRSFNGSTVQGRFWIEAEERTVSFTVNRGSKISANQRSVLSWSLDQWVSKLEGFIYLSGFPLTSRTGLLKHVFITKVRKA